MRRDHTAEAVSPTAATFLSRRGFLGAVGGGLAATTLAACGSGGGSTGSSSEIVFMNQSRGQAAALGQLAQKYTRQTGVKIKVDNVGPADFLTKLQSSSQSRDMPDIYSAMDSFSMAPYYKAGWAMDLSDRMKGSWGDTFRPTTVKASTFAADNSQGVKPGIYSAHWEAPALGIFINAAMFKAAGLDPDKPAATMSEFIDQLVKIKRSGKDPFWFAASNSNQLVQSYASNYFTDEELNATFLGKSSWKSDGWRKSLQILVDLRDAGVISTGSIPSGNSDNPNVEKAFFNTQGVAAIFDGTSAVGVARATAPDFTDFRSLAVPKADDGTQTPRLVGGTAKGAAINPRSKNAAKALKFVQWLTEPDQQQVFAEKVPLIPSARAVSEKNIPQQLAGIAAKISDVQLVENQMKVQVITALQKGAQAIVLKERTVDQVLGDLDAAQRSA
ncbi:ABC-type glycerol-3-phosphate transport system substrate-binding protein [Streptomyces sp. SAI-144]|jgi:ABC-type glycerol-3-phosphate transport system substrate-binding protein|uniref:ABC transporter substrate-binding protein n=1 Tax=Streptomyces sp. SAI-144 TaxID=2940544 RepID=UPI002474FEF5|nr:extracellular solute-binding protein [Streptomyces sp. SAI-144]MDH6437139.1 ABC-type glycerol-3-phosphate transport system substrate-binding protein [Streptomyces sp. SAI-144]